MIQDRLDECGQMIHSERGLSSTNGTSPDRSGQKGVVDGCQDVIACSVGGIGVWSN